MLIAVLFGVIGARRVTLSPQEQSRKMRHTGQAKKENVLALSVSYSRSVCVAVSLTWRPFLPSTLSWVLHFSRHSFPPFIIALCMVNV